MKIRTVYETPRELAVMNNKNAHHEVLTHATMLSTANPSKLRKHKIPDLRIHKKKAKICAWSKIKPSRNTLGID
jgi:hypothetical protein